MKRIFLVCIVLISTNCFSVEVNNLILVCGGRESGYKTYLQTGKKTTYDKEVKDQTYQIENGTLHDMKCEFSESTIWCHKKGEETVLVNSYLIYEYDIQIDRYSGKIRDYTKETMTHNGVKTELVNDFVGKCNRVNEKKF